MSLEMGKMHYLKALYCAGESIRAGRSACLDTSACHTRRFLETHGFRPDPLRLCVGNPSVFSLLTCLFLFLLQILSIFK